VVRNISIKRLLHHPELVLAGQGFITDKYVMWEVENTPADVLAAMPGAVQVAGDGLVHSMSLATGGVQQPGSESLVGRPPALERLSDDVRKNASFNDGHRLRRVAFKAGSAAVWESEVGDTVILDSRFNPPPSVQVWRGWSDLSMFKPLTLVNADTSLVCGAVVPWRVTESEKAEIFAACGYQPTTAAVEPAAEPEPEPEPVAPAVCGYCNCRIPNHADGCQVGCPMVVAEQVVSAAADQAAIQAAADEAYVRQVWPLIPCESDADRVDHDAVWAALEAGTASWSAWAGLVRQAVAETTAA